MDEIDLSEFMIDTRRRCRVKVLMDTLGDDQRLKVEAALRERGITTATIMTKLKEWSGQTVTVSTVGRHRKGECSCD